MKNILIVLFLSVLCIGYTPTTHAQVGYESNKLYLDIGIRLPRFSIANNYLYSSYGYNRYSLPNLRANLEYGFSDIISGGAFVGYSHYGWKWTDVNGDWNEKHSYLSVGGRMTFHVWNFLNNNLDLNLGVEKLDLYASLMLGALIKTTTDKRPTVTTSNTNLGFYIGPTFGAKYYFTDRTAVFIEGGYGAGSYGIVGLTFKL